MSDSQKPPIDIVPLIGLERIANKMQEGAARDGRKEGDWKSLSKRDFVKARQRHMIKLNDGDTSEDHEAAIGACTLIIMWFEAREDLESLAVRVP